MTTNTIRQVGGTRAPALALAALAVLAASLLPTPAQAHGGEDHGDEGPPAAQVGLNPRVTATSEAFEIVGVPSAAGNGRLVLHLTDFWSNAPITKATIEVTHGDTTIKAVEKSGAYALDAPWVKTPGQYDLIFAVTAGDVSDLLIGTLSIPAAPPPAREHNTLWDHIRYDLPTLPAPSGWLLAAALLVTLLAGLLALRTVGGAHRVASAVAALGALSSVVLTAALMTSGTPNGSQSATAKVILDLPESSRRAEDGTVFVPKTTQRLLEVATLRTSKAGTAQKTVRLIGQIIPDPNKSGLVQTLLAGRIEPPEGGFPPIGSRVKAGDRLGYLVPRVEVVDQSDIRQTIGDLDRQITLAEAKLSRLERLKDVVSESQIGDTRIELQGLLSRRAAIKPTAEREPLIAPVDGVVAEANVASGQVVEAQTLLFQIVDPASLWVEALAFDSAAANGIEKLGKHAVATTADGQRIELEFKGRALTLRQQAVPLRFTIKGSPPGLSIGEPVTVDAPVDQPIAAIPLPRSSVVRSANGQAVVWSHIGPERFEARAVSSEPIDADRIGITAGLEPDTRIVVRGAELINQVR